MATQSLPTNHEKGLLWLLKMLSGLFIILILGVHLVVNHLVAPGGLLSYLDVVTYFQNPWIILMESVFLICAVSHSLLGLRAILMDLNPPTNLVRITDLLMAGLGAVSILYGIWLLIAVSRG